MKWRLVLACILVVGLVYAVNSVNANVGSGKASLTYSGYLTSDGSPSSGDHEMTFKLYEVESGGTALDSYTVTVSVEDGYFTTELKFDQKHFDQDLWLGVQVGSDSEMSPRLKLNEVPYSTSPKFLITEQQVNFTGLEVKEGLSVYSNKDGTHGIHSETTGKDSEGVWTKTESDNSEGVFAWTEGVESDGVHAETHGDNSAGVYAITEGDNSIALYGKSAKDYGVYGEGKFGGYFTTNQAGSSWPESNAAIKAETDKKYSQGVRANTSGDYSDGVFARTEGDDSRGVFARTEGDDSVGVFAWTEGVESEGVYAVTRGEGSDGVVAWTEGEGSDGVYAVTRGDDSEGFNTRTFGTDSEGLRTKTEGDNSEGVYAETSGKNSIALYGKSAKDYGVYGEGKFGGYFTTNQAGSGSEPNAAIKGETDKKWSKGVHAHTKGDYSDGVYAKTEGEGSQGVHAHTKGDYSDGVWVRTEGDDSAGVWVRTESRHSEGVIAAAHGDNSRGVLAYSDKSYGVWGETGSASAYGGLFLNPLGDSLAAGLSEGSIKFKVNKDGTVFADGHLCLNYNGPDYHSYIYFYDNGNYRGERIGWNNDYDRFETSNSLRVDGDLIATGSKSFVMDHPDESKEIVYTALEGDEAGVYTRGTATLEEGMVVIDLPEHFGLVASDEGLTVQVTPLGDCNGLYIAEKSNSQIVVKELMNGESNVEFDYFVQGVRVGYEDYEVIRDKVVSDED